MHLKMSSGQWQVSESAIKFNRLFGDSGYRGPCSPYKQCNYSLYIGIIIFSHIDNTQCAGHGELYEKRLGNGTILFGPQCIDSLWHSQAIWWKRIRSTLAQVMACCLTVPSQLPQSQCWLLISEVLWHSPMGKFTEAEWLIYASLNSTIIASENACHLVGAKP